MSNDAPVKKAKKKKAGFTADDWPRTGSVTDAGFCTTCRSHWCPHAAPGLYVKRDLSRFYNGRGPVKRA